MPLLVRYQERDLFLKHTFVEAPGFVRTLGAPPWPHAYRRDGPKSGLLPPLTTSATASPGASWRLGCRRISTRLT
jgi:hypothetical protein